MYCPSLPSCRKINAQFVLWSKSKHVMKPAYRLVTRDLPKLWDVLPDYSLPSPNYEPTFLPNQPRVIYSSRMFYPTRFNRCQSMPYCRNAMCKARTHDLSESLKLSAVASNKMRSWKSAASTKILSHRRGCVLFLDTQTSTSHDRIIVI